MTKKITNIIIVLMFSGWVGAANASLIFDFSFTNAANGGGVVTGEILGLSDNATGAATSVRVLTNTAGFGIGEYAVDPYENLFEVSNGQLVGYNFESWRCYRVAPCVLDFILVFSQSRSTAVGLSFAGSGTVATDGHNFVASLRVVPDTTVPAPGTVMLLLLGTAGLLASRYRKQS
jgi:hypothetical protein